jgi:hypothetical protein
MLAKGIPETEKNMESVSGVARFLIAAFRGVVAAVFVTAVIWMGWLFCIYWIAIDMMNRRHPAWMIAETRDVQPFGTEVSWLVMGIVLMLAGLYTATRIVFSRSSN